MKKPEKASSTRDVAAAIAAKMNTRFGKRVIAPAAEVRNVYYLRRPSGIMQLDIDTAGGLPSALVHCISGPDSGGKTLLLYRYMSQQQRYYGKDSWLVLAPVEHPLDHFRLNRQGVRVAIPKDRIEQEVANRKRLFMPAFTKEQIAGFSMQIGEFQVLHGETQEDTFQAMIDLLTYAKSMGRYPNIIGLDSVSAMTPKDSLDKDFDQNQKQAVHAANVQRFFAKYFPLTTQLDGNPVDTTFLMTQQVRANKAKAEAPSYLQKFLPDYAVTGAHALKHGKCFDIMVTPGKKEKEDEAEDKGGRKNVAKRAMRWELVKAKAGSHEGIFGEVQLDFSAEDIVDDASTVVVAGVKYGILREAGKTLEWPSKFKGTRAELHTKIREDLSFDYALRSAILETRDISCAYFL